MDEKLFYVDTSIWLNLFKREGDPTKGKPYWEIARNFFEIAGNISQVRIIVPPIVLKELSYKLGKDFAVVKKLVEEKVAIIFEQTTRTDYAQARAIEREIGYSLSFADCLHITIAHRLHAILVTRDRELITIGRTCPQTDRPENLLQ